MRSQFDDQLWTEVVEQNCRAGPEENCIQQEMPRAKITNKISDKLMWASDRTCNLCQKERLHLEIHHINGDPGDNRYSNLILLCRNCHSEVTAKGLGRKVSSALLLKYKLYWEGIVQERRRGAVSDDRKLEDVVLKTGAERAARIFEDRMLKRDAQGVLALFTPPRTKRERDWLKNYIIGGDLGRPGKFGRLFATRGFGYKVLKYDIRRLRVINTNKVEVAIEEWRTWWGDGAWDPVPRRCRTALLLIRFGNEWFVDKYREPSDPHYRHKYGGLNG